MSWQTRYSTSSCRWCGTLTPPPSMPLTRRRPSHDANLTDVTSADVNASDPGRLGIAVVGGAEHRRGSTRRTMPASNVWSSGAATAAFDAFDDHSSVAGDRRRTRVRRRTSSSTRRLVHAGLDALHDADVPAVATFDDPSAQLDRRDHRRRTARRRQRPTPTGSQSSTTPSTTWTSATPDSTSSTSRDQHDPQRRGHSRPRRFVRADVRR